MEAEADDQLATAVLHDFTHALLHAQGPRRRLQGLAEAEEVLLSYAPELSSASASSSDGLSASLLGVLRQHALAAAAVATPASVWGVLLRLTAAAAPRAPEVEQAVWAEVAAALLAVPELGPGEARIASLEAARGSLPPILDRAGLAAPPAGAPAAAAAVDPRGALLAALLLHLFPTAASGGLGDCLGSADAGGEAAAQRLLGLAGAGALSLAGRSAADHHAARGLMQQAFAASVATLQSPSVQRRMGPSGSSAEAACCQRAFSFLQLFKQGPPAVADQWWGVFAAAARQLAVAVERAGPAAAKQPPLAQLVRALFHSETAAALAHTLLAIPLPPAAAPARESKLKSAKRGGDGAAKHGGGILPKHGWASAYEACLQHDPPALLLGAAEVLRPDASYALSDRVAAVQVMARAADRFLARAARGGAAHLGLWQPLALDLLLLALAQDPSIRLRREVAPLLASVAAPPGSPLERRLVRVAVQRCRDRDPAVRAAAFVLLAQQYPRPTLHSVLTPADWRNVLDVGLTPEAKPTGVKGAGGGGRGGRPKAAAAISRRATRLLKLYLAGGGEAEEQEGEQEGEEGSAQGWAQRLRWVLPYAGEGSDPADRALAEAYEVALRVIRPPRAGSPGGGEAAEGATPDA